MRSLRENLKPRPYCTDRVMRQGRALRFLRAEAERSSLSCLLNVFILRYFDYKSHTTILHSL